MLARSRVLAVVIVALLLAPTTAHASGAPSKALARFERLSRARAETTASTLFSLRFRPGHSRLRPPTAGVARFDQSASGILYSSAWSRCTVPYAFGGAIARADRAAAVDVTFEGTAVSWLAVKGPSCGIARLSVDGWPAGTVDLYRKGSFSAEPVWATAGLLPGVQHHLRIEWTGTRSPGALDDLVTADGFDIRGSLARDLTPPVTQDDVAGHDPYVDSAEVNLAAHDDGLGVAWTGYSVDGGAWTTGTVITIGVLGEHTVAYRSVDLAGNIEDTRTVTLRVRSSDVTPPVTSSDATAGPYLDTATVHLSATDLGLGVAETSYRLDAGEWVTPSGHTNGASIVVTMAGTGEHVLEYRSTDLAGNVEETRSVTVPIAHRYGWADAQLRYQGQWGTHADLYAYLDSSGSVTATFTGTSIYFRQPGFPGLGVAAFSVDDSPPVLVDLQEYFVWSPGRLAPGRHVLRMSWTGLPGPYSYGYSYVALESLDVVGELDADAAPLVRWDPDLTPPDGAVLYSEPASATLTNVYGNHLPLPYGRWATQPLSLVASGSANAAWPSLTSAGITVDSSSGPILLKEWMLDSTAFTNDGTVPGFDPFRLTLPFSAGLGLPYIPDGRRTFRVRVTDAIGTSAEDVRTLIVDNHPPDGFTPADVPWFAAPSLNRARYDGGFQLAWNPVYDGTDPVATYRMRVWPADGPFVEVPVHDLSSSGSLLVTSGLDPALTVEPFSAYRVQLVPTSPLFEGTPSATCPAGLTPPRLTGTAFNAAVLKKNPPYYRFSLSVSQPSSATLAAVGATSAVYLFNAVDASTYTYTGSGDLPAGTTWYTDASPTLSVDMGIQCDLYWQVQLSVFDSGGGMVKRFRTNVIGPLPTGPSPLQTVTLPVP